MRLTFSSTHVDTKGGNSAKTGKPWTRREQEAIAETERFRMPVRITLGDQQAPYAPGVYTLDFDASVTVGQWGDLQFARVLSIKPLAETAKRAAA